MNNKNNKTKKLFLDDILLPGHFNAHYLIIASRMLDASFTFIKN